MNRQLLLIAVVFLAAASAQEQRDSSSLHCRLCDSDDNPDCETKPDETLDVECRHLDYSNGQSRSSSSYTQNKNLAAVFKRESSRALTANEDVEYRCIKVVFKNETDRTLVRSCAPLRQNIDKACDFIRQQIDPTTKVNSCHECDTDLCNSALSVTSSILSLASVISVWFLIQF